MTFDVGETVRHDAVRNGMVEERVGTVVAVEAGERGCGRRNGCCETPDSVQVEFDGGHREWIFANELESLTP